MAGTKVRGITIELSADASGINSALKDVNKNISSTSRELKDIDKLLKLDPTNVQLLAQKQEALQRQMEQTRDKIKLLKDAEEDLKKQMVDGGTEEQKKQLAALEREIISSEKYLEDYTQQMDQAGKETDQLAASEKNAEQATGSMSEGFTVLKGALASLVADGIRLAADALKDLITEGPKYADEILTMAKTTSMATDTLQELDYMSGLVDVDVNTVAGSMKKLTKNMDSARDGSGSAADAFKTLGVSVTDSNGELRKSEDVFFDAIEALVKIENEAERYAVSMSLFGKSATDLNPLIEAGADQLRGFADEAHEMGYVLDEESLEALGRVQDAFDRFDRKMVAVKNTVASGLAPAIERGMKRAQAAVDSIDWKKIGETIGNAFEGIISAFEWIIEHGPEIKAVLAAIIAAFAAQKIIQVVQGIQKMTKAMLAMNAAADANPYVLLATALIAVAAATVSWAKSTQEMYKENNALIKAMSDSTAEIEDHITAIDEMTTAYEEASAAREASISSGEAEIAHVQALSDELATLADENGNVADKDKARAEFILGELNTALGTEYTMTGNVIDQYKKLEEGIDAVIQQKRAEIILQAQEEAYRQAIIGRTDAERELEAAIQAKFAAEQNMASIAQEITDTQAAMNQAAAAGSQEVLGLGYKIQMLKQSYSEAEGKVADLDTALQAQADVVDQYAYDVTSYEANMTKAITGDYDKIEYKSWETAKAQKEATNDASKAVITNATAASKGWLETMSKMVSEATGKKVEFRDAGGGMVKAVVDGVEQDKEIPANKVKEMAAQMVNTVGATAQAMYSSAKSIDEAIALAIADGSGPVYTALQNLASGIVAEFNKDMKINSPAKVMFPSGKGVDEGIAVSIAKNKGIIFNEMDKLAGQMSRFNPLVSGYAGITSNGVIGKGSVSNSFVQNNYSPKALSRLEIYRQTQNLLSYAGRV